MPLNQIKQIVAVASGKGGVGKSTVAVNLALALLKNGATVGLLDADIYGPSQPAMLGTQAQKPDLKEGKLAPILQHGLKTMSIGYLVDLDAPIVWRGPMLGKALEQLLNDTEWGALDYLIIDLPPGTGDVQITLCQKVPVSGAVMVTTPQEVALMDVRRACEMFKKLHIPILGVIENMSVHHCSHCGHTDAIFGEGGGIDLCQQYECELLGQLPLVKQMRELTDSGQPPVFAEPDHAYSKIFLEAGMKLAAILAKKSAATAKFPKIVVEHTKKEG